MNVSKREVYKEVELSGRKWRIGKFDARTALHIATKLAKASDALAARGRDAGNALLVLAEMSEAEQDAFQAECLSVCAELLPAGPTPVLDGHGNFGVLGLEHDLKTILALMDEAMRWGTDSFFPESPSTSEAGGQ